MGLRPHWQTGGRGGKMLFQQMRQRDNKNTEDLGVHRYSTVAHRGRCVYVVNEHTHTRARTYADTPVGWGEWRAFPGLVRERTE